MESDARHNSVFSYNKNDESTLFLLKFGESNTQFEPSLNILHNFISCDVTPWLVVLPITALDKATECICT